MGSNRKWISEQMNKWISDLCKLTVKVVEMIGDLQGKIIKEGEAVEQTQNWNAISTTGIIIVISSRMIRSSSSSSIIILTSSSSSSSSMNSSIIRNVNPHLFVGGRPEDLRGVLRVVRGPQQGPRLRDQDGQVSGVGDYYYHYYYYSVAYCYCY